MHRQLARRDRWTQPGGFPVVRSPLPSGRARGLDSRASPGMSPRAASRPSAATRIVVAIGRVRGVSRNVIVIDFPFRSMASIRTATGCWASALPATVIRSEATNAVKGVRGKLAARAAIQSNNREKRLRFDDIADPATKPVGGKLGRDGLCGVFAHKGEGL